MTKGLPSRLTPVGVSTGGGAAGPVAWADVTGKPTSFTPSAHGHVIGDVTGLQSALDGKQAAGSYAAATHGHAQADVTGLVSALAGKSDTGHTHASTAITDFAEAVDDRVAALLVAGSNVTLTYNDAAGSLTIAASGGGGGGVEPTYWRALAANATGTNANTAQPWFPSAGALTIDAGLYRFEGQLFLTSGVTSHSVRLSFGGTSTRTGAYLARGTKAAVGTASTTETTNADNSGGLTTNRVVTAANTTAATQIHITGLLRVSAAGTLIPQFQYSAAPGSSSVLADTWFGLWAWSGTSSATSKGTWA